MRRTATASNALGRASSVPSADVWREEPAMNVRAERPRADRGKEGNLKAGRPFQNLQRFIVSTHARTQWPLKGADGFVRARSSGKTGAPFSHLPTGGRAGARIRTNLLYSNTYIHFLVRSMTVTG